MWDAIRYADSNATLPSWVPEQARQYLEHTETGAPIRALARATGCHASTVLRRIRTYEARRDDLLVDQALRRLGRDMARKGPAGSPAKEMTTMTIDGDFETKPVAGDLSRARLEREALRLLRHLIERGAVLAVAADMEKAVVVRDTEAGTQARTAVAESAVAEAMALNGWISCDAPGRISRYRITREGRAELGRMMARAESVALGATLGETQGRDEEEVLAQGAVEAGRCAAGLTPLLALARRRDKSGRHFLSAELVRAGERLREDFELGHMATGQVAMDWSRVMTGRVDGSARSGRGSAPFSATDAGRRAEAALRDLGPGLGDIALRCCCKLEGLESAEKRMGWSARSGKIVLRIALQRLRRFYEGLGDEAGMIG
ncbi:DUF6456 domain-containing protein [Roseovarius sp. E0-M6]|uniref:DUF6456 domain-containing protein n=1 Tax=Roseovarius sp. E0-M6 TaxID=3127118 RepID=UPI0030103FA4